MPVDKFSNKRRNALRMQLHKTRISYRVRESKDQLTETRKEWKRAKRPIERCQNREISPALRHRVPSRDSGKYGDDSVNREKDIYFESGNVRRVAVKVGRYYVPRAFVQTGSLGNLWL